MPDDPPTPAQSITRIAAERPTTIADYMAAANGHYYATRDPLGVAGDFTTAPEISQMFGEMIGVWVADMWLRAGHPAFRYVELGPGRGTLAADALRAMARFGCQPQGVHLVETSPTLRAAQLERLPHADHHDDIADVPDDVAVIIIANEFFDALPIHQYVATPDGWRERMVERRDGQLVPTTGDMPADDIVPAALRDQPDGTIVETAPVAAAIMQSCAFHLSRHGGAMLVIDYGHSGPATGDTLQAVKAHRFADPFADPGEVDLTAHVDFTPLAAAARRTSARSVGPVGQGAWLQRLGIDARRDALAITAPGRSDELTTQRDRLVHRDAMGTLFQVMAVVASGWPHPAGFEDPQAADPGPVP